MRAIPTKVFSVYDCDVKRTESCSLGQRKAADYKCNGPMSKSLLLSTRHSLQRYGFCICPHIIEEDVAEKTWKNLFKLAKKFIAAYDSIEDEFVGIDSDDLCITRMPRIGRGKHNIHFDPILSPQHEAVAELARKSHFSDILTHYYGSEYSLRESGFSLTRPVLESFADNIASLQRSFIQSGEGMEWHSDGGEGEATVLMSLTGISSDMGPVRIMPRSHKDYVDGVGHSEEVLKERKEELVVNKVDYVYERRAPLIFDARTLHSVANNISRQWRIVIWLIYDCY